MTIDFKNLTLSQQQELDSDLEEIISSFNNISDQILADMPDRIEDLISNTVSRNVFFSSFLEEMKCLHFIRKKKIDSNSIIIVYHKGLYKVLKDYYKDSTIILKNENNQSCRKRVFHWFAACWRFLFYFLSKSKSRKSLLAKTRGTILVDSYLHENSISKGKYIDRYFCNMLDYVEDKSKIFYLLLFLPLASPQKAKTIAVGSKENIIFFFDLLKLKDYFCALLFPFRLTKLKKKYNYLDFNINPLIEDSSHNANIYFMYGYLYYCFFKRAHEYGCDIKHVLDWYENQSYDKGLYYGLNKYFPHATVNAYVGFITNPEQTPHNIPTEMEYKRGIAPNRIYLCNQWLSKTYSEKAPYAQCKPAAFFRSQKIWSLKKSGGKNNDFTIIVPLSLNNEESFFKVKKIKELANNKGISFMLKPHPDTPKTFISELVNGYEDIIKPVYGSIYDYLIVVDAMLATNSTTIYESVALGVPIIALVDETDTFTTPQPKGIDSSMWYIVKDQCDFTKTIGIIQEKGYEYFKYKGELMKERFFEPVTKESVEELLSIK